LMLKFLFTKYFDAYFHGIVQMSGSGNIPLVRSGQCPISPSPKSYKPKRSRDFRAIPSEGAGTVPAS
jgi:hypothetical protein